MTRRAGIGLGLGLLGGRVPLVAQQHAATSLALDGVTVIDVAQGKLVPQQRVVITGNRIQTVGGANAVKLPKSAQVVDARGKYLIPGLWDMHVHVNDDASYAYPRFIGYGITGIREMAQRGSFPDSFRVWQHEVREGTRVGPRGIGPSVDLDKFSTIATPEDAHRVVDSLKAAGEVFLKEHGGYTNPIVFAILREARRIGIAVVGHIPSSITSVEAADSGMRSIEHIDPDKECWEAMIGRSARSILNDSAMSAYDDSTVTAECTRLAAAYVRNGTWLTPTLTVNYHVWPDDERRGLLRTYVGLFHRLGFRKFLAGTDYGFGASTPELHQELALLTESGLTPLEALQAATINPAQFLEGTDSLGTVAPGKVADLVLLDADPLTDITNTTKIRAVVANGRYYDRPALDRLATAR